MNSKKKRVVAVILYKNGNIVQSKHFNRHKIVGSPFTIIDRLSRWNADEVIYLNIRPKNSYQIRKDLNFKMSNSFDDVIKEVSKRAFMPITVGGGISSLKEVDNYFKLGADKISINTSLLKKPQLLIECSKKYGSQSIVASIDLKKENNKIVAFTSNGKEKINFDIKTLIKKIEDMGAGEILLNCIHKDGDLSGFDIELINNVKNITKLPIIALGGAGNFDHFYDALKLTDVDAIAASNIFHYTENSYYEALKYLNSKKCNVRPPVISELVINKI